MLHNYWGNYEKKDQNTKIACAFACGYIESIDVYSKKATNIAVRIMCRNAPKGHAPRIKWHDQKAAKDESI